MSVILTLNYYYAYGILVIANLTIKLILKHFKFIYKQRCNGIIRQTINLIVFNASYRKTIRFFNIAGPDIVTKVNHAPEFGICCIVL